MPVVQKVPEAVVRESRQRVDLQSFPIVTFSLGVILNHPVFRRHAFRGEGQGKLGGAINGLWPTKQARQKCQLCFAL